MLVNEIPLSDSFVGSLVRRCCPNYRGRKPVRIYETAKCHVTDYWDGGSKDNTTFVNLNTMCCLGLDEVGFVRQTMGNPFNQAIGDVELKPGIIAIVSSIFCGKQMAIKIYVNPNDIERFKP